MLQSWSIRIQQYNYAARFQMAELFYADHKKEF